MEECNITMQKSKELVNLKGFKELKTNKFTWPLVPLNL